MTGGTLIVDTLSVTNGCGYFNMNGGALVAGTLVVTNDGQHFTCGSGSLHYNQLVLVPNAPPLVLKVMLGPQGLVFSWPSVYVGYQLQNNSDLSTPRSGWTNTGNTVVLSDDGVTKTVAVPLPQGSATTFYQLAKP